MAEAQTTDNLGTGALASSCCKLDLTPTGVVCSAYRYQTAPPSPIFIPKPSDKTPYLSALSSVVSATWTRHLILRLDRFHNALGHELPSNARLACRAKWLIRSFQTRSQFINNFALRGRGAPHCHGGTTRVTRPVRLAWYNWSKGMFAPLISLTWACVAELS